LKAERAALGVVAKASIRAHDEVGVSAGALPPSTRFHLVVRRCRAAVLLAESASGGEQEANGKRSQKLMGDMHVLFSSEHRGALREANCNIVSQPSFGGRTHFAPPFPLPSRRATRHSAPRGVRRAHTAAPTTASPSRTNEQRMMRSGRYAVARTLLPARTSAANDSRTSTVASKPMQPSVMLWP
jgi:hypothetical protein